MPKRHQPTERVVDLFSLEYSCNIYETCLGHFIFSLRNVWNDLSG